MTPDPYKANNGGSGDPREPGSWNRYAYTRGDPANRFDPAGTCDMNITTIAPDGTIVIDCIDFPTFVGGDSSGGGGGNGSGPGANPCQSLVGAFGNAYDLCMAAQPTTCVAPNVMDSNGNCITQQQQCLNSFNNSTAGAATNFLSAVSLIQNLGNLWVLADWSIIPLAKIQAINVIQDLSNTIGNTDFYSIAGTSQTASIETEPGVALQLLESQAAAPLLFAAVPIATAIDAGVQQMCSAVPGLRFN